MLRKDVLIELGCFREDFLVCEDYDLWLKLTSKYDVGFIDQELIIKYAGHQDQLSYKFVAMDYWRIKSIDWILKSHSLNDEKRNAAMKVLKKKTRLLLKGYLKHNNLTNYDEILSISNHWD
jgi:hypothetical protein